MAPGRPRGRKNIRTIQNQQLQAQAARAQQQQRPKNPVLDRPPMVYANPQYVVQIPAPAPQPNHPRMNEETNVPVHDEADLISFRQDAQARYIANHEYLENLTKSIHTKNIRAPRLYPKDWVLEPTKIGAQEPGYALDDPEYVYQRAQTDRLAEASAEEVELVLAEVEREYKHKFGREYRALGAPVPYSHRFGPVDEAPADYDPAKVVKAMPAPQANGGDLFGGFGDDKYGDDMFKGQGNMEMGMGDLINFDGEIAGFDDAEFLNNIN